MLLDAIRCGHPHRFLRRYISLRNPWVMQQTKVVLRNTGDRISNSSACSRQAQSNVLFLKAIEQKIHLHNEANSASSHLLRRELDAPT
jgi:hypothetical protein